MMLLNLKAIMNHTINSSCPTCSKTRASMLMISFLEPCYTSDIGEKSSVKAEESANPAYTLA